jgi:hypothetical protein
MIHRAEFENKSIYILTWRREEFSPSSFAFLFLYTVECNGRWTKTQPSTPTFANTWNSINTTTTTAEATTAGHARI